MPRVGLTRLDSKRYLLLVKINTLAYGNKDIKHQFQLKLVLYQLAQPPQPALWTSLAHGDRGQGNRYLEFSHSTFNVEDYQRPNRVCGAFATALKLTDLVKMADVHFRVTGQKVWVAGRWEGVGHKVLSLAQWVGRAIFSLPQGVGHPIL